MSAVIPGQWIFFDRAPSVGIRCNKVPIHIFIGPKSDHWECLSLTHWLTNSLTECCLVKLVDMKMPTQNLLRLLLLLMLVMRTVLATVCCILGSRGLVINLNFCSDFEHKVWSRFCSWSSGRIFKLEFGQYFTTDVLQRLWSWILVERDAEAMFGQYFESWV